MGTPWTALQFRIPISEATSDSPACCESATPLGGVLDELASRGNVDAWKVQSRAYSSVIKWWGPHVQRVDLPTTPGLATHIREMAL